MGLSNPARQNIFTQTVPNALDDSFKYRPMDNKISIYAAQSVQDTGLIRPRTGEPVSTTVWGYGSAPDSVTWPGMTFEMRVNEDPLKVTWINALVDSSGKPLPHLLPVDPNTHWAYALPGYEGNSIAQDGIPLVPHVHGGANDSDSDGNPEYFASPGDLVTGPRWISSKYTYGGKDWNDVAGMVWYHDHGLGLTRLNVYAGLAGFFVLRDENDTGKHDNEAGLPAGRFELGFAVQDRMFRNNGELFYPAFPGDPAYEDFITGERAVLPPDLFPDGGPTALAEFFGDHMVVNGKIWPKYDVEQRQYRVRLLNGCDSRFMLLRLRVVDAGETNPRKGKTLPFYIVGSDQSLRRRAARRRTIYFAPGERLDLVVDFKEVPFGSRVIIENLLGDSPFGGEVPDPRVDVDDFFDNRRTDRIMAFDVNCETDRSLPDTRIKDDDDMCREGTRIAAGYELGGDFAVPGRVDRVRKLALFEGKDEFGRLQPLLGTAEPAKDAEGNSINWPDTEKFQAAGLVGPIEGSIPWHVPITENPGVGDTEIWEIYNVTGDAHPMHVHLVHFKVLNREAFLDPDNLPIETMNTLQHNGEIGHGFRITGEIELSGNKEAPEPSERTRRDMVMALPGQVTRIKMTFDKPGRYVWHCHILSHEDHEMMRPFHVGPGAS
jgi:FtsP/CotA-like multicopper oxidase with cupredoxin domain